MNSNRKAHEMTTKTKKPIRPQNKSRPAGGASAGNDNRSTQSGDGNRGVIVAPPSGNTWHAEPYLVVHRGFDTLALAIKANISTMLFDFLDAELKVAAEERREVLIV